MSTKAASPMSSNRKHRLGGVFFILLFILTKAGGTIARLF
ncbi:hypothetical protein W04_3671 [Pseudoalteromonas sp. SW0106-04]|nr:hypothetical protein W04_3671 [Pseudoalteromonas sp. SW0106-04]